MTDLPPARIRDRSPPFPYIGLAKAVDRLQQLYSKAKRHEVYMSDASGDWGFQPKSSSLFQTVGALIGFGLIEDSGSGESRKIRVSEFGWRIIEDNRPGVREGLMSEAALKPKLMGEMAALWADGRPDDAHAKSQLKVEKGFTEEAASKFLRVYDDTISYVIRDAADKTVAPSASEGRQSPENRVERVGEQTAAAIRGQGELATMNVADIAPAVSKAALLSGEREWSRGPLSKDVSYRLFFTGEVTSREIGKLIKLLDAQRSVLEDED